MTKVLRNTNFKLNNGFLDYGDVAEIEVEKTQLATRTLQYGDIILEKSGGSDTQAIGRVVLFDKTDNETYSYSNFCSRIRVLDTSEISPVYLWIVLHNFYCKGGTIPLQNGIRLLNIDMNGYSKIKIPVPPIDIQKQIVEEIEQIDEGVKNANNKILNLESQIVHILEKITSASNRRLGDIVTFKNGLNYDRNSNGDIIKIIGVGDFQNNKTPKWESLEDIEISGNLSEDYELHKNDLLVVRSNGSASLVGRFLLIDREPHVRTSFSGFTIRLRLANKDIYDSKFLFYLNSATLL